MDVKSLYDAGKLSDSQMVRLVRLGTLGNKLGITVDEFEEITGKSIETVISLEEAKQLLSMVNVKLTVLLLLLNMLVIHLKLIKLLRKT